MKKTALFLAVAILFSTTACDQSQGNTNANTLQPQSKTLPENTVYTIKNYDHVNSFNAELSRNKKDNEGLANVTKNDKHGLIDKTGKEVIPVQYDNYIYFSEELAEVRQGDKWGYIDKTGKVVIDFQYNSAKHFNGGFAQVVKDGKITYIDKTGKESYDFVQYFKD